MILSAWSNTMIQVFSHFINVFTLLELTSSARTKTTKIYFYLYEKQDSSAIMIKHSNSNISVSLP